MVGFFYMCYFFYYIYPMKKIIGLLCIMAMTIFASVSFASNGPETTKDCVIGMDVTMEVTAQINQDVIFASKEVIVNESNCYSCFTYDADKAFGMVAEVTTDLSTETKLNNILEDPGVDNNNFLNNYNLFELNYLYRPSLS